MKTRQPLKGRGRKTAEKSPARKAPAHESGHKTKHFENGFTVVGIGCSAGGLEATTQLLRHLPSDTAMAFVVVQHLAPSHESALVALLGRATPMPVLEARTNMPLQSGHVYVIPPNKMMSIRKRRLKLTPRQGGWGETHAPVDYFMRSLAEDEGSSAIGVVLSGSGSDGTAGLQAIKAAGGITFGQDTQTAKYPTMPASAIAVDSVDFVLAPEAIGRELGRISGHPYVVAGRAGFAEGPAPTEDKAFTDILATLRQRLGVDFTYYKHATLRRRIQRRMVLRKLERLKEYAQYVRTHTAECRELFNDVLIHVTGFFRDPTAFAALKKRAFPRMIKGKTRDLVIRVWVPGCSSGEEVYSIAIALKEYLAQRHLSCQIQIFGTDINEGSLEKARTGVYSEGMLAEVSETRLRRFFSRVDAGYRINKSIREMCVFARQNVVADPPFSNLDLISCRNVLIYLGQPLHRRVFPVFHYALRPGGVLLLGAAESIGGSVELFGLVDRTSKLYVKRASNSRPPVMMGTQLQIPRMGPPAPPKPIETPPANLGDLQKQTDRILLSHFSPTGVVINRQFEVLQFRGRTGDYLEHPHGEASLNLLKMAREGLSADLRSAMATAVKQNSRVRREHVRIKRDGTFSDIAFEVIPLQVPSSGEHYYLVMFEPANGLLSEAEEKKRRARQDRVVKSADGADGAELARLRQELSSTRESLQAIIEEQEATNEELRSANEEIMSSNEELQSTNEELETAKEELQSTNEELTTLNEELENRNEATEVVNSDLHNLLANVNFPLLILGPDLRIRRFTVAAEKVFNLIPADVGREVTDLALKFDALDFPRLVQEVIDTLATKEQEVRDKDGRWWFMRVRPYRTMGNKIDGAVITLADVDVLKQDSERYRTGRDLAEAMVNTVRHPLVLLDKNFAVRSVNREFCSSFKVSLEETIGRRLFDLGREQWNIPKLRSLLEDVLPKDKQIRDFEVQHEFPTIGQKTMKLNAQRLELAGTDQQLILLAIEDVTNQHGTAH